MSRMFRRAGLGLLFAGFAHAQVANLAFYDVRAKQLKFIEDSPQEIDEDTGISVDRGGKYLFYAGNDNGTSSVHIRNLQNNKIDIFRGLPRGVVGTGGWLADPAVLVQP